MRAFKFLIVLLFIWSCSNKAEKNKILYSAPEPEDRELNDIIHSTDKSKSIDYIKLSEKKLQEVYDLNTLKTNYPDFEEIVSQRLSDLIYNEITIDSSLHGVRINNVRQIGEAIKDEPNKTKLYIRYDVVAKNRTMADSIYVIIHEYEKKINKVLVPSIEIKFVEI